MISTKMHMGGWKEAQRVRECAALAEHLSSVPGTHIGLLTTSFNLSSRESDATFWHLQALHHMCVYLYTYTCNLKLKCLWVSRYGVPGAPAVLSDSLLSSLYRILWLNPRQMTALSPCLPQLSRPPPSQRKRYIMRPLAFMK